MSLLQKFKLKKQAIDSRVPTTPTLKEQGQNVISFFTGRPVPSEPQKPRIISPAPGAVPSSAGIKTVPLSSAPNSSTGPKTVPLSSAPNRPASSPDPGQQYRPPHPGSPMPPPEKAPTPPATPVPHTQATTPAAYGPKDTLTHAGLGLSGALRGAATTYRDLNPADGKPDMGNYMTAAVNAGMGAYDTVSGLNDYLNKAKVNLPASPKDLGVHVAKGMGRQGLIAGAVPAALTLAKGTWEGGAQGARNSLSQAAAEAAPGVGLYAATKLLPKVITQGAKFVPGAGALMSAYTMANRLNRTDAQGNKNPDYPGAALDAMSGAINFVPGIGAVGSNVIDAVSAIRDVRNSRADQENIKAQQNQQKQQLEQQNEEQRQKFTDPKYDGWIKDRQGVPMYPIDALGQDTNQPQPGRIVTASHSKKFQKINHMKTAENRFKQDLEDSSAGKASDLYQAILPIISSEGSSQTNSSDIARTEALKEDVRKGLVGLEYMTGLKKNTGESFYDEHPAQAVATNLLGNYGKIGLGVGGAGLLANALRQHSNMKLTEPAKMSREGNREADATHPRNLLQPSKGPIRPDIARLFGDLEKNPERRLGLLDAFVKQRGGQSSLLDEFTKAESPMQRRKILEQAALSEGHSGLEKYVDLHESLQRAKQKGGFKKYVGEKLHNLQPGPLNDLLKKLAPNSEQAVADLLEKYNITGAHTNFDESLIRDIVKDYRGGKSLTADPQGQAFIEKTLKNIRDPKYQSSGVRRFLGRNKLPIAAGAAAGLGSAGLYALIKAMQDKMYSKDKTNEWKKTLLQSRGDFDAAEKIQ